MVIKDVQTIETLSGNGSDAMLTGLREYVWTDIERLSATSGGGQTPTAELVDVFYIYLLLGSWDEV